MADGSELPAGAVVGILHGPSVGVLAGERTLLNLLGVLCGTATVTRRFVDLVATQPARMYGLHPRKGSLSIGADADIVVFDPELRRVIRADKLHQNVDYTPYEGMVVDGWPVLVMSRGDVIIEDMQLHAAAGRSMSTGSP